MTTPRDRTPVGSPIPAPDPDQLMLGGLDPAAAAAAVTAHGAAHGAAHEGEDDSAVALREPPVCGEWSFDADELPETRAGVVIVPTPSLPQAAVTAPRMETRRGTAAGGVAASPQMVHPSVVARVPVPRHFTPAMPLPAIDELKSIHDAYPGDEQTAIALSNALAKRGNIEGALGVLQRGIDAGADTVMLRCARAAILSGRLRYDDAEQELKRAQKAKPDDPGVLLQQGILACRRAKWRDGVEPLARVVKHDPLSGPAHFYLGEALSKLDRLGEALEAYHRAAELEPDNWRAFKGVGIVLDRMGRPAEAAEFYRRARDGQRAPT